MFHNIYRIRTRVLWEATTRLAVQQPIFLLEELLLDTILSV